MTGMEKSFRNSMLPRRRCGPPRGSDQRCISLKVTSGGAQGQRGCREMKGGELNVIPVDDVLHECVSSGAVHRYLEFGQPSGQWLGW